MIVKQDNKPFNESVTSSSGKYNVVEAPFGHQYTLIFEKEGLVTKTLILDTKKGFYEEDTEPRTFIEPSISMFVEKPDIDYSIIENQPVGKARIDPSSGKLDWDYAYSGQRKNEIERYLKQVEQQARQKEAQFKKMVTEGNNAYNKKDYQLAILKYEEALNIKDDDALTKKIEDAKKNLQLQKSQKELQEQYDALIQKGNNALSSNNFDAATDLFTQAKDVLPGNQIAYDKLREVERKKQDLEEAELNKQFTSKMNEAQKAYEDKEWDKAKQLYNAASTIKPTDRTPKDRIIEIDNMLANMKADEENYNNFISKADQFFSEKKYEDAISNYKSALKIKPNEAHPKDQITKAEQAKKQLEEDALVDRKYQNLIKSADNQLKNESYEQAKSTYEEALALKENETYPKDQIALIEKKINDLAAEKERLEKLKQDYDNEIIKADQFYKDEKWEEAKQSYQAAKTIKSDESYPDQMIKDIELKLQHLANLENEKQNRFNESIASADAAFKSKNWTNAKQYYNDALSIFSEEKYPTDQLVLIDQKIAEEEDLKKANQEKNQQFEAALLAGDELLQANDYSGARSKYEEAKQLFPNRVIVDQKLNHLKTLEDQLKEKQRIDSTYNSLIDIADKQRDAENWEEARGTYHDALVIKPLESYPQEQIGLIENKLTNDQQAKIKKEFDEFIVKADQFFQDKSYEEAIDFYDKANEILPSEVYPLDRIREIKRILGEIEGEENKYKVLINQADNEYESENWEKALTSYESAKNIFDREYPNKRIEEITKKLNELKANEEDYQKKRAEFDQLIKEGDRLMTETKYVEAKDKFVAALEMFDQEYYPKKKIAELDIILEKLNASKETTEKYNQLVSKADGLRDEKKWEEAKKTYIDANQIVPSNPYPQEQINFINDEMKKETNAEFKVQYDKLIAAANSEFSQENYDKAKELFNRAKSMNPEDNYPMQKLSEIDQIFVQRANNDLDEKKFNANKAKYDQFIQKADAAKDKEDWEMAKSLYIQANNTFPSEEYPQQQITYINQKMKESAVAEIENQYNKIIDVADQMFKDEKYDKAINLYRRAQSIKPDDDYPPAQIKKVEEAKMIAFNNQKEQEEFGMLVRQGKRAFAAQNYRLSLKKFQQSLKINPDAKLPKEKITEINKILDENSKKHREKNKEEKNKVDYNDYSTLYGEEVTGKYNEDEIDAILNQGRVNDVDNRGSQAEYNKDNLGIFVLQNTERQKLSTNSHNEQLDIISNNIGRSFDNSDDSRWKIIPQLDQYKDQTSYLSNEARQLNIDKTMRVNENFNRISTNEVNMSLLRDQKIALNNSNAERFFDEKMVLDMDNIQRGISITYDNAVSKEMIYNEVDLENIHRKQNRDLLINNVDNFKENLSIINESDLGHSKNVTYTHYDSKEALLTRITENSSMSDNGRSQKIVPSFDYYKDDILSQNNVSNLKGINATYDQFQGSQSLTSKLNQFAVNSDNSREQNALDVNHYLDKEASKLSVWSDVSQDKVYNVHMVNERVDDAYEQMNKDKESDRAMNVSELNAYSDRYMNSKNDLADLNERSNYMNSEKLNNTKEEIAKYTSDNNTQKLAQEYPEGITEKLFERKNTLGEVIEVTILRIVVRGNKGDEYRKVKSKWGVSYFKNGGVTSEYIWDTETN